MNRIVKNNNIYTIFPEKVTIGTSERLFVDEASKSHIRLMVDCHSQAMKDDIKEAYPVHHPEEVGRSGVLKPASESLLKARDSLNGRCVADFSSLTEAEGSPMVLQQKFHSLKRAELEVQRVTVEFNSRAKGVAWKFKTKHYDLTSMQDIGTKVNPIIHPLSMFFSSESTM
ncbi:hypothetical protein R1sor_011988 [Riccia sorocarpa]|uniref:Uncharacterized protein n=1 Tax=Riccia sorocarpa TaxID=122646 RepID=A0ABD3I581_9MARC